MKNLDHIVLQAAEQAQAEPVQTGHCAACNIETGTVRPCDICGAQTVASKPPAVACNHRIADARNAVVTSGYACVDCGALFSAADHNQPPAQQHAEPLRIANPSPEQLYTMVTSRFKSGTFPWSMVSVSGKAAWAAAAAELAFAPDTIMASHAPQPTQQQAEPVARDVLMALGIEIADKAHAAGAIGNTFMDEEVAAIVDRYAAQKGGK